MQRMILFVGFLAFLVLGSVPRQAQVIQATVSVQGMSCPFCAFGVEKKLRNVPGVESVEVDMAQGTATLKAADEKFIAVDQVPEAVRRAGFTPGPMEVVAQGTLRGRPGAATRAPRGPPQDVRGDPLESDWIATVSTRFNL